MTSAPPPEGSTQEPTSPRFSLVLAAGAHNAPFSLNEPASENNWLGPAVLGSVRYQIRAYLLALRLSWETSERSVDMYYLKNTYLAGTLGGSRVFESGIASFAVGLEAGVLLLHQNVWLDGAWQLNNGASSESMLPGQTGKTNSTGMLLGPVAEFNISPTPRLFLHLEAG